MKPHFISRRGKQSKVDADTAKHFRRAAAVVEFLERRTLLSAAFTITDLGALGDSYNTSETRGINDSGQEEIKFTYAAR